MHPITLYASAVLAQVASPGGQALDPAALFKKLAPSVVVVEVANAEGKPLAQGSGVVVEPEVVVTNRHVVKDGVKFRVRQGETVWPAVIKRFHPDYDLVLLSVPGFQGPPVPLRPSSKLITGERVYALGSPEGLELTLSEGLVSGLRPYDDARLIQTSAAISHGSSGGGLFDARGRLAGVTTFALKDAQSLNFALPAEWVASLLSEAGQKRTATSGDPLQWLSIGFEAQNGKDYEKAARAFREATQVKPDFAEAWFALGTAYSEMGRHKDSVEACREAVRLDPSHADAWVSLGMGYGMVDEHLKAVESLREGIRLGPHIPGSAWHFLALEYFTLDRYPDAIRASGEAIRLDPDYAGAWYTLGRVYAAQGQHVRAIQALQESIRRDPGDADSWREIAESYREAKQPEKAVQALREAIRLRPGDPESWLRLGQTYYDLKDHSRATSAYREAVRLKPDHAFAWYLLGLEYALLENRAGVTAVYEQLKKLDPAMAEGFFKDAVLP